MIKSISIDVIKHKEQRYETAGDWLYNPITQSLVIYVSDTGDWRESISVAIHEMTEAVLCIDRGISQKEVDDFDLDFEDKRSKGLTQYDEPGVDPAAPYYDEHRIATILEKMLIKNFGIKWDTHNLHLDDLDKEWGE